MKPSEMPDTEEALSWRDRRRQAESDTQHISEHPENERCAARIRKSACDQKWEIRKVIAEGLAIYPEALSRELGTVLAMDSNAMVRAAAHRSITRRSPASALSSSHSSIIQNELERIERKFGIEARQEAFRLAERTAFLHIRTAAHDIKNILTHFNVDTLQLLKLRPDQATESRLHRLDKGREYLIRLVGMMEAYSRDLDMKFQNEDLVGLVNESVQAAREQVLIEGKISSPVECVVSGSSSIIVTISRFHFSMVLTNLIKNAIQSHAISERELRAGRVDVTLSKSEAGIRISITDTGKGISTKDLQRLLDFVPGNSSKPGGMGYGLPICRKYTEAHGGSFTMQSEENKGTEVVIVLPEIQPS